MAAEEKRVPRLIAFDLDYTLWDLDIDSDVTAPLHRKEDTVQDEYGSTIEFYPDVSQILNEISSFKYTIIAACSRTDAPVVAREALSLIHISLPGGSAEAAIKFFDQMEIYPGSKITHFRELHRKTGIPYTEMLFYDDEPRNSEVKSLGVTFILVENGLDNKTFYKGLNEWRKEQANTEL